MKLHVEGSPASRGPFVPVARGEAPADLSAGCGG